MSNSFVVIDDHASVLEGTCSVLRNKYPDARIITANTADKGKEIIEETKPNLVLMDLSIPEKEGGEAKTSNGLNLLNILLSDHPTLNILVQSAHIRSLVRLKPLIDEHQAGFTTNDKSMPSSEMLTKVDWALKGLIYTPPELRTGLDLKPEWMTVLKLAVTDNMTDSAIADKMNLSERTIRAYWTRIQDVLEVYPERGINIRLKTYNQARKVGLLD